MAQVLIIIISICTGYVIGNSTPWEVFYIDTKVNLPQIFTIINTLIIALIFNHFLARKKDNKRFEKKFLSEKIQDVLEILEFFCKIRETGSTDYLEIVGNCKRLSIKTIKIFDYTKKLKFKNVKDHEIEKFTEFTKKLRLLTTQIDNGLIVKDNKARFNKDKIMEIEKINNQMEDALYEYLIDINEQN